MKLLHRQTLPLALATVACASSAFGQAYITTSTTEPRPIIGVYVGEIEDRHREAQNYKGTGVAIIGFIGNSPAKTAGAKIGDILVAFNGTPVTNHQELVVEVQKTKPGDEATMKLISSGLEKELKLTVATADPYNVFNQMFSGIPRQPSSQFNVWSFGSEPPTDAWKWHQEGASNVWLGLQYQELNASLAEYFETDHGILISNVIDNSPAGAAGIKAGDVLTRWNDIKIQNGSSLKEQLKTAQPDSKITLRVVRKGQELNFDVTLASRPAPSSNSQLRKENDSLRSEISSLKEENEKLRQTIEDLKTAE